MITDEQQRGGEHGGRGGDVGWCRSLVVGACAAVTPGRVRTSALPSAVH
jgi:hypothetical protein